MQDFIEPGSRADYGSDQNKNNLIKGIIVRVDPINHVMDCEIDSGGLTQVAQNVRINNLFTDLGYGVQIMPIAFQSVAWLYKISATDWMHVGYFNPNYKDIIADENYEKENETENILQRYVNQGEVHLSSQSRNEIFLSNDGSIFFRAQYGAFLKLDNQEHRLDGNFANLKYEMDGVRIRAGNVIRPTETYEDTDGNLQDTNQDEHIVIFNDEVIYESDLPTIDDEGTDIKEFMIQVGTSFDPNTGVDIGEPSVGIIGMGNKIIDEIGEEISAGDKSLNFIVKNSAGGGIAIDEDGAFLIIDHTGGSVTKFTSGSGGEKSFRVGNSFISVDKDNGVFLQQDSGSAINLDTNGNISLKDANGRTITMNESGLNVSFPGSTINLQADKIVLVGEVSVGGAPMDAPLPAMQGATAIDLMFTALMAAFNTHVHSHPMGPTLIPMVPLVVTPMLPQVMSSVLKAAQFNIS